jgi:5-methylcytosine-specific restriction endonuclease McrA
MTTNSIATMSNDELLGTTVRVAGDERRVTSELLALLAELDARRLYLREGCSSLFAYCTQVLYFSEHAAYHRIETARAARYFPLILELVSDGSVTTTTVALLRPHLTIENHARLLAAARHKSKREVEHQIACLAPKADVESIVRRMPAPLPPAGLLPTPTLPTTITSAPLTIPATQPKIEPLASDRYLLRVTLSAEGHANLRRAQSLSRHAVPNGDLAALVERALAQFVALLERQKIAATSRPRRSVTTRVNAAGSRHIPAAVRREVWKRDGGRCAFVGPQGRCTETGQIEFHHVVPFARGGPASPDNIWLRCRAHNGYESEQCFGRWGSGVGKSH